MALNTKRMQTFFNEFLVTTVSFLNQFSSECEDKFFELERKLNKIESNLTIVEEKLASVPTEEKFVEIVKKTEPTKVDEPLDQTVSDSVTQIVAENPVPLNDAAREEVREPVNDDQHCRISESAVYGRYFKMLKYGINAQAVKLKMQSEQVDPSLLDNPDLLIEKTAEDLVADE